MFFQSFYFLFFIFLKPILPTETKFKEVLSPLETARINIKNFGSTNNAVKITQLNKNNAKIWEPLWYVDYLGRGTQIEITDNHAIFNIKCINDGKLSIVLLGLDRKGKNNKRIPIWIDYTKCLVNGRNILHENPTKVWHDKTFKYELDVKNNEEIKLEIAWKIHDFTDNEIVEYIDNFLKDMSLTEKEKRKLLMKIKKKII